MHAVTRTQPTLPRSDIYLPIKSDVLGGVPIQEIAIDFLNPSEWLYIRRLALSRDLLVPNGGANAKSHLTVSHGNVGLSSSTNFLRPATCLRPVSQNEGHRQMDTKVIDN